MNKPAIGLLVRLVPGATFRRFTGDEVGEIEGVHFDAGAASDLLYLVRFPPGVVPACYDGCTLNTADELEVIVNGR